MHGGVGLGIGWVGMATAWQIFRNLKRSEASLFHLPMVQAKKYLKARTHGKVEEICEGNWSSQGQWWPSDQINCGCSLHSRTGTLFQRSALPPSHGPSEEIFEEKDSWEGGRDMRR